MSTHTAGVTANTDSENLLIREPVFDGLGRKVSGQHKIVWIYYQSTSDKKKKNPVLSTAENLWLMDQLLATSHLLKRSFLTLKR
ncbi:MAG: hypothetical protein R2688_04115 [Fimbriimonadaceae bacterium]